MPHRRKEANQFTIIAPGHPPQVYRRGVSSAHGRKGANQFTKIAPGHPSGVQAKGVKRTWTEGSWRGPALDGPGF
eukprot:scaffold3524_cov94-Phaeocystis_antarctica.AAC.1